MFNEINIEKLDKIPAGVLKDITPQPATAPAASGDAGSSAGAAGDIFSTGSSANIDTNAFSSGTSGNAVTPTITQTKTGAQPLPLGGLVPGTFAVNIVDTLVPVLVVVITHYVGYKIDKNGLKLTQKDKEILSPATQAWLDSILINMNNPFYNFLFALGAVYAAKVIEQIPDIKKIEKATGKVIPIATDKVINKIKESEANKDDVAMRNAELAEQCRGMNYATAILHIKKERKLGDDKAKVWYSKNVG